MHAKSRKDKLQLLSIVAQEIRPAMNHLVSFGVLF
jgi:hypothetical protein